MDGNLLSSLLPLVIIIVIFYFMLILPQKKQAKARQEMLNAIKVGDKIETVSRAIGFVTSVDGEYVVVNIGAGDRVEIKIHREGVARVINDNSADSGSKAA